MRLKAPLKTRIKIQICRINELIGNFLILDENEDKWRKKWEPEACAACSAFKFRYQYSRSLRPPGVNKMNCFRVERWTRYAEIFGGRH